MERWVQRALARIQPVTRNLPDTVGDTPAVIGSERKDLQNQQVESADEPSQRFRLTFDPTRSRLVSDVYPRR